MSAPDEPSNVIPFRRPEPLIAMPPEIVEVVEIIHWYGLGFNEFWIAAAGPWKDPPEMNRRGRHPWQRVATFPHTEPEAAAQYAIEMAHMLDVPIVDLAKILPRPSPCAWCGVNGAHDCIQARHKPKPQDADA
jgi:hypothetical protein